MSILPYARLLRLPNVFTAFADIALGLCVAISYSTSIDPLFMSRAGLVFLASGCLYLGGMVWNDWFDFEEDRRERSFRPLPSGKISLKMAFRIGVALLVIGFASACASGLVPGSWQPDGAIIGGLLVIAILLYNARLKRTTWAGPLGMGACRYLNVLLGLTLIDSAVLPWSTRRYLALIVGVYIAGVTWFARTEEKRSNPDTLRAAGAVMLVALLISLTLPIRVPSGTTSPLFPYLLVAFGFWIGVPVVSAIRKPTPERVQSGVKRCILGLVALDALLATVFIGERGLLILLLLPPALLLGKWVYST